jgi:HPt (histidine-containing phosphotransfer) domain-containing protein
MIHSAESEPPVLDPAVMASIRSLGNDGEPDVYVTVARLFLADAPSSLSTLVSAIVTRRSDAVYQMAHRLRGGAMEIGALRMVPLCAAIEEAARAGSLEDAPARARRLEIEFAVTRTALEEVIQ